VIDVIREVAEYIPLEKGKEMSAAQFLEKFLFPRSMHFNYVRKLSGGERRRLKLMRVLMSNPNFLILDEPTNDLDIFVMSVLEDYLKSFQGCLIVVSHDRYFMDKMVDHILVFEGKAEIKDIIGNYTVFREQQKLDKALLKADTAQVVSKPSLEKSPEKIEVTKKKLSYKEKVEFDSLEAEIEELEQEKTALAVILTEPEATADERMKAGERLTQLVQLIEQKSERWLELAEYN
jgi:ABC transport system ATP-binding/permease protein